MCVLLDSLIFNEPSKALFPHVSLFAASSFPGILVYQMLVTTVIDSFIQWWQVYACKCFQQTLPGSGSSSVIAPRQNKGETKTGLCASPSESHQTGQNTEPQLCENKVPIVPSGTSNLHHKCRLLFSWPPPISGLEDGK